MKRVGLIIAVLALLVACAPQPRVEGTPVEIVQRYYAAWAQQDYRQMYALVSDGWKVLEPTAHTEKDFAAYVDGFYTKAKGIRLTFASEQSNTGNEATISVALEVETLDGTFLNTNQSLTLRLKDTGWKLIHPYGEYKDLS